MSDDFKNETIKFEPVKDTSNSIRDVVMTVYEALKSKGYNPENQIIGYILSGDPTYITSFNNARNLIRQIDRDELLGELLSNYINKSL